MTTTEMFTTGLDNPRGLAFGPDGSLFVAEGGRGGDSRTTDADCPQIPIPIGPYTGGMTARISRVRPDGARETVVDGLPSSQTSARAGGSVSGVADVAFVGATLYALVSGGGCSHGLRETKNGVYRIADGAATLVADLGASRLSMPVANPDPADDEYDGTWYSMIALDGELFAVEPNHGEIVRVGLDGRISRLVDLSATQGHLIPTALTFRGRDFFVGNLGAFPFVPGSSKILRVTRAGAVSVFATGLTAILGLDVSPDDTLYALESSTTAGPPGPASGRLVRVGDDGSIEPVAIDLALPTGMTFGPDGAAYVSTFGMGPAGAGRVERIAV